MPLPKSNKGKILKRNMERYVIPSERSESRDLRTADTCSGNRVPRFFDSLRSLRMTFIDIYFNAGNLSWLSVFFNYDFTTMV